MKILAPVLFASLLSFALTFIVREVAKRIGFVAKPNADRWHQKPTAMLGGVSVFLTVAICYIIFVPHNQQGWVILTASSFMFLVGLIDDKYHIKPYQKLIGQVMGATFVVFYGMTLPWTSSSTINMVITIFWLVGITNAINLLDNMDGLAAGISIIASSVLAYNFFLNNHQSEFLIILVFIAALFGFLIFNFNPASIFMGDCGSMFIGFFLASTVLLNTVVGGRSRSVFSVLAVPVLILFVPIFDTTFVTVLRKLKGRAASQGGRDHTSHRLVALGLTERKAVLMLYSFASLAGVLAVMVGTLKPDQSIAAIAGFVVILTLLGVYLAGVKIYDENEIENASNNKTLYSFLVDVSYKRRIFEVALDVLLIMLAYYSSYALLFGPMQDNNDWRLFLKTVPLLVIVKLAAFLWSGVYRGLWRYTSIDDLMTFAKGIIVGSVISVMMVLLLFRFQGFSRRVFFLDCLILFILVTGSRMAFRLFRQIIPTASGKLGRRILIYGAGDGGELLLRELRNNEELEYTPIGFVDDDPLKKGKVIHGLKVLGGNGSLLKICREYNVEEILISSTRLPQERINEVIEQCNEIGIVLKRMKIEIEPLNNSQN
jgi:UDP-GlcNAc:undecaprenyl-phosphate GlcNAc-1-phosphate transferase